MTAKARLMTADDLLRLPEDGQRHELVRGELRTMPLPGGRHGRIALKLGRRLGNHVEAHDLGETYAAETGFLLSRNPDTARGADVAFVRKERLSLIADPDKHVPFAPDLAAEVISPSDRPSDLAEKTESWLAAGTRMVWNLYPRTRTVQVHRPGAEPITLGENDILDGGEVVPGFRCPVGEIFA